jgi:hypothetical protein
MLLYHNAYTFILPQCPRGRFSLVSQPFYSITEVVLW